MLANIRRSPPSCCRAKAAKCIGRTEADREAKQRELAQKVEDVKQGALVLYPWLVRFFPGTSLSNSDRLLKLSRAAGTRGYAMLEGPRSNTPGGASIGAPCTCARGLVGCAPCTCARGPVGTPSTAEGFTEVEKAAPVLITFSKLELQLFFALEGVEQD